MSQNSYLQELPAFPLALPSIRETVVTLSRRLRSYEPLDLIATVAALQIMPENAERSFRLQVLATAAFCRSADQSRHLAVDLPVLARIVQAPELTDPDATQREHPYPGLFTECVTCANQAFIVFPGPVDDATFVLRRVIDVLFSHPLSRADSAFVIEARALVQMVLALSDRVARHAG